MRATSFDAASEAIDRYLTQLTERQAFSVSVVVARAGDALLSRGYGFADRATRRPNTPSTRFRLSWLGEEFVNVGLLQLADEGRLELERSICAYVPHCPRGWRAFTLRRMLSADAAVSPPAAPARDRLLSPAQRLPLLRRQKLIGRHHISYANEILFAYILERLSGQSWQAYLTAHLFGPLGMTSTSLSRTGTATPYVLDRDGALRAVADRDAGAKAPMDNLAASPADLLRYDAVSTAARSSPRRRARSSRTSTVTSTGTPRRTRAASGAGTACTRALRRTAS